MIFPVKLTKNNPLWHLWWLFSQTRMHRIPKEMFLQSLRKDHFSNSTKKYLSPTPPFLCLKNVIFLVNLSKNDPLRHLRWLFSQTHIHRLPTNMFLPSLRKDHFSNSTKEVLGPTPPFLYLKKCYISSQI